MSRGRSIFFRTRTDTINTTVRLEPRFPIVFFSVTIYVYTRITPVVVVVFSSLYSFVYSFRSTSPAPSVSLAAHCAHSCTTRTLAHDVRILAASGVRDAVRKQFSSSDFGPFPRNYPFPKIDPRHRSRRVLCCIHVGIHAHTYIRTNASRVPTYNTRLIRVKLASETKSTGTEENVPFSTVFNRFTARVRLGR